VAEDSSSSPNLIWIDTNGGAFIFKRNPDNSFTTPPGTFGTLVESQSNWTLTMPHDIVYTFSRDASIAPIGRLTSISEPHGESVNLTYDSNGRLLSISTGLAGTVTYTRDANGHVIQVLRNRDSLSYLYAYDPSSGMLVSSADFDGNTMSYTYNSQGPISGLLSTLTDPLGRQLQFQYDSQGRAVSQIVHGGGTLSFQYGSDSNGPVTTVKDIDGQITAYHFNSRDL